MSKIVAKLNLNKTPQVVEPNSLIMAKNIRLLEDGTIGVDTSLHEVETRNDSSQVKYVSQIVGLNDKIYFFKEAIDVLYAKESKEIIEEAYPEECFIDDELDRDKTPTFDVDSDGYVTRNGVLFEDRTIATQVTPNINDRIKIYEYDEVTGIQRKVKCGWKYSGGEIIGCVTTNNTGEDILTICEYNVSAGKLVPIKHINLAKCKRTDDESIYTQAPNIPITNMLLTGRYVKTIPAGVYQFFIRYKIRDGFYTTWMPCSKEVFAGTPKFTKTIQGDIRHVDLSEQSNASFIFDIIHLYSEYCSLFEEYQIGFIISSEQGVVARSWKHFNMSNSNNSSIYFEYNQEDIEEINIDDLLKVNYDIFNVGNIAYFKNKLYIANYKETDFNERLENYAKQIKIKLKHKQIELTSDIYFDNNLLHESSINDVYDTFGSSGVIKDTFGVDTYCNIDFSYVSEENTSLHYYGLEESDIYTTIGEENLSSRLNKVYVKYNNNNYYVKGSSSSDEHIELNSTDDNSLFDLIINDVRNKVIGINGTSFIYQGSINNTQIGVSTIKIAYKSYDVSEPYPPSDPAPGDPDELYDLTIHNYILTCTITLKDGIITNEFDDDKCEYNTLLPFTKYSFYVHYVKQNGITTNGYLIDTKEIKRFCKGYIETSETPTVSDPVTTITDIDSIDDISIYDSTYEKFGEYDNQYYILEEDTSSELSIIYPEFSNIICPPGYVACFISVSKNNNAVAQLFNHAYDSEKPRYHKFDCLELDTLLYNEYKNISIKNSKGVTVTTNAKYHSSVSTSDGIEYLGCSGNVYWDEGTQGDAALDISKYWLVLNSTNRPYNKTLIKLTPYITLVDGTVVNYSNYEHYNSPGYFCKVCKLNRDYCDTTDVNGNDNPSNYFVSGTDIYTKILNGSVITLDGLAGKAEYHSSDVAYIISNFNLNYVSLKDKLQTTVRLYEDTETHNNNSETVTKNQFITLVDSLQASSILQLHSMYKEYTRKTYSEYTKIKITDFNNTIRSSNVNVDEIYRYVYRFEATDYYNIPANRGIITNLISIISNLYVHCEHALFKFTDSRTLNSDKEQVVLQENDIFNSGISEMFDAQYGYAGLSDRKHSLITYNAYIFYDSVSKVIYAFQGEQQLANISDPIKKLINKLNPTDLTFVADEQHNRFFVNFINGTGNVCLSFNFANKSFISIHDIHFKLGFHSRSNTYFIHDNLSGSSIIGWSIYKIKDYIETNSGGVYTKNYCAYQNCYKESLISIYDSVNSNLNSLRCVNSCLDIIVNPEYEKIKVINFINWVCSDVQDYVVDSNFAAEETNIKYPAHKIRIYTDSTYTELIDLIDNNGNPLVAHNERNINTTTGEIQANPNSWQYIQDNCGVWSMNYFRDVKQLSDKRDLFEYKDPDNHIIGNIGDSQTTDLTPKLQRKYLTQESSLIYGKYFVVRFIFSNRNFKLENLKLNMNDYEKVK